MSRTFKDVPYLISEDQGYFDHYDFVKTQIRGTKWSGDIKVADKRSMRHLLNQQLKYLGDNESEPAKRGFRKPNSDWKIF